MLLEEFRDKINKANIDKTPTCSKLYINFDERTITVGCDKCYGDMRLKRLKDVRRYYTLRNLIDNDEMFFVSDGNFEATIPEFQANFDKGKTLEVAINVDDFEVIFSEEIEKALREKSVFVDSKHTSTKQNFVSLFEYWFDDSDTDNDKPLTVYEIKAVEGPGTVKYRTDKKYSTHLFYGWNNVIEKKNIGKVQGAGALILILTEKDDNKAKKIFTEYLDSRIERCKQRISENEDSKKRLNKSNAETVNFT